MKVNFMIEMMITIQHSFNLGVTKKIASLGNFQSTSGFCLDYCADLADSFNRVC